MEIMKQSEHVSIIREGDAVRKTWLSKLSPMFPYKSREVMFYTLAKGVPGVAEMIEHGEDYILLRHYPKNWNDHVVPLGQRYREEVACKLFQTLFELHRRGICHGDVNPGNIMLDENLNPFLIDSEFDQVPTGVPFYESFDVFGRPPVPLSWQGKAGPPVCYLNSVGPTIGFSAERAFDVLVERLKARIVACSGSEKDADFKDLGYAYSSYEFPGFALKGWRNTKVRMQVLGSVSFAGKTILDVGSGTGTMLFEAARAGAKECVGIEVNKDRVDAANDLSVYLGLKDKVRFVEGDPFVGGVEKVMELIHSLSGRKRFDMILFLSLMGRIPNGEAIPTEMRKMCRELILETNHVDDKKPDHFESLLKSSGFADVRFLGKAWYKSDCENPIRYIFKADTLEFIEWE